MAEARKEAEERVRLECRLKYQKREAGVVRATHGSVLLQVESETEQERIRMADAEARIAVAEKKRVAAEQQRVAAQTDAMLANVMLLRTPQNRRLVKK